MGTSSSGYRFLRLIAGVFTEQPPIIDSAGAGDSGKIPALDAAGKLDNSFMPVGIGAPTKSVTSSENLAAGDFVNLHVSSGLKVRKADATTAGKQAHGFVLATTTSGNPAIVYFEGTNTMVTGLTAGDLQYLSTTPGLCSGTAPSTAGNAVQNLGVATDTTEVQTEIQMPVTLA